MSLFCCCKACYSCGIFSACRMSWFIWMSSSCQQMEQRCRGQRGCSCKCLVRAQLLAMLINYWYKASNQLSWEIKLGAGCWDGKELKESYASLLSSCSRAKSGAMATESSFSGYVFPLLTLLIHKQMNWTLIQEMSILLGYLCVDKTHKTHKTHTCLCQNSVLFFLPDIDLDWQNQGEKQPLLFPGCTVHPASFGMCLIEFGLCKNTSPFLSYYVMLSPYKVE